MTFGPKDPALRALYALMSLIALIAIGVMLSAASPAFAAETSIEVRFSDRHRELIVAYARDNGGDEVEAPAAGKGKKKQKGLPPGIAKNLERGKPLPPGIAKTRLPAPLVSQLPPPPRGHEIVVVDGRVLLIEVATQVIRDRLEDVFLR